VERDVGREPLLREGCGQLARNLGKRTVPERRANRMLEGDAPARRNVRRDAGECLLQGCGEALDQVGANLGDLPGVLGRLGGGGRRRSGRRGVAEARRRRPLAHVLVDDVARDRDQGFRGKRLGDVVDGSRFLHQARADLVTPGAHHDHRYVPEAGVLAEQPADLEAVEPGTLGLGERHPLRAPLRGPHLVASPAQGPRHDPQQRGAVVDDEDVLPGHGMEVARAPLDEQATAVAPRPALRLAAAPGL